MTTILSTHPSAMKSLVWVLILIRIVVCSSSAAPWQPNSARNVVEEETYSDLPPIVFYSDGRLYAVERTVAAASSKEDGSSNLAVAFCCKDAVVVVTTCNMSPHLHVVEEGETNATLSLWVAATEEKGQRRHGAPLSQISPNIWMVTGGNAVDSCILREKIVRIAQRMRQAQDGGHPLAPTPIKCSSLARRVSDHLQLPTQTMGSSAGRILSSYAILVSKDENGPCIWRIDPTGQFWKCRAAVIGRDSIAAEGHLVHVLDGGDTDDDSARFTDLSIRQVLSAACKCIQATFPKEKKRHWQALVWRLAGEQSKSAQVLHGDDIDAFLSSTE